MSNSTSILKAKSLTAKSARGNSLSASPQVSAGIFHSSFGWFAFHGRGSQITRLRFGWNEKKAAEQWLESESAPLDLDWWAEPIEIFTAFLSGKQTSLDRIRFERPQLRPFSHQVIDKVCAIPYGKTLTYQEVAEQAGSPRAARAVGNVMRKNQVPLLIPCHRVVGSTNSLGGYTGPGGLTSKETLLEMERANS